MLQIRHILFPVDFSPRCSATAGAVQALAQRTGAMVTLFHAVGKPLDWIDPPHTEQLRAALEGEPFSDVAGRLEAVRATMLQDFRPELWNPSRTRYVIETGDVSPALLRCIESLNPDLVMIPTHGHGGFRRFLTGSVTNRLLHDVKGPIWTDAHVEELRPGVRDVCDQVYCAVDLVDDDHDLRLIRWAVDYAKIWNAGPVRLIHAVHGAIHVPGQPDEPFAATLMQMARENLANLQKIARTNFPMVIEAETPGRLIMDTVGDPKSSVVIIGRGHHDGLFGRLGSQAYSIIRSSPCPVISI